MSVPREYTPWTMNLPPYLGVSRAAVKIYVIASLHEHAKGYCSKYEAAALNEHISDVITSLPDDDVVELNYAATEMGQRPLAEMFMSKMNSVGVLRREINDWFGLCEEV